MVKINSSSFVSSLGFLQNLKVNSKSELSQPEPNTSVPTVEEENYFNIKDELSLSSDAIDPSDAPATNQQDVGLNAASSVKSDGAVAAWGADGPAIADESEAAWGADGPAIADESEAAWGADGPAIADESEAAWGADGPAIADESEAAWGADGPAIADESEAAWGADGPAASDESESSRIADGPEGVKSAEESSGNEVPGENSIDLEQSSTQLDFSLDVLA